MRLSFLPSIGGPAPLPARPACPSAVCGGELGPLDGPDGLYCPACGSVVVLLRDGTTVWHPRHAEPRTIAALHPLA